jgi:phosphomannomutase/phosphoglucomutase
MINQNIFRQYDIRGVADQDLTDEVVAAIGKAFAVYLVRSAHLPRPTVVVGRDIRPSSTRIQKAVLKALVSSGISVTDIGVVTTPVCYFSMEHLKKAAGIMITGSHNPLEYNGLKLVVGRDSVYGDEIQKLRRMIERKDFVSGEGAEGHSEIIPAYQTYLKESFRFKRKLKVAVDSGNGTAGLVAPKVIRDFGHETIELFSEPDSRFPNHHPDPTVERNLEDLICTVKETGADAGLAFDGDADRLGVIDDQGTIVWGDKLLILFSRFILKEHPGAKFVADVKCSNLFFEDVRARGGHAVMWKTGHSLIKQKLREENALLGGEMSGHLFFADRYFGFDDGLYAGIRVLEILDQTGKKLSELLNDIPKTYATPEIRVECPDEQKFDLVSRTAAYFKNHYPTIDIDGVRIDFGDGWGLVRASNTQPILVTRFEAATAERLREIRSLVEGKIEEFRRRSVGHQA